MGDHPVLIEISGQGKCWLCLNEGTEKRFITTPESETFDGFYVMVCEDHTARKMPIPDLARLE